MKENNASFVKKIENAFGVSITDLIFLLMAVMVIAGIIGFIYEMLFYRIDLGYWTKRGTTFGPWISIYAWGGLLLTFTVYHLRKRPLVVFLLSCLITGVLEFLSGYLILKFTGERLWDYNTEIWNWGNIGGFVCARSVLVFGIGGLALVYLVIPIVKNFYGRPHGKAWKMTMMILCLLFILDIVLSHTVFQ